jgi:hypothetical protein
VGEVSFGSTSAFLHPATFYMGSIADLRKLMLDALKRAKAKRRRKPTE